MDEIIPNIAEYIIALSYICLVKLSIIAIIRIVEIIAVNEIAVVSL